MKTYVLNLNTVLKTVIPAALVAVSLCFFIGRAGKSVILKSSMEEKILESISVFYPLLSVEDKTSKTGILELLLNENLKNPDKVITGNFPIFESVREKLSGIYSDVYESNSISKNNPEKKWGIAFPEIIVPDNVYRALETTVESVVPDGGELKSKGLCVKNHTTYSPDIKALYELPLEEKKNKDTPSVLIVHTHGSESYNPSDRSEDIKNNIVRVGAEMAKVFEKNGIGVIHSEIMHDIPRFNSSYSKSLKTITGILEEHPDIKVVLDVHRDAMMTENGDSYKTVCEYNGEKIAQVMFVVGTDGNGLSHPKWELNLSLALKFQEEVNKICPNLARPVDLRNERFNQQTTEGSLIIEVGTNGNTLDEAVKAGILAAEGISAAINKI